MNPISETPSNPGSSTPGPYPLLFEPILMPKVWGGRRLAGLGKKLPANENIGESWELADLAATSASGGGGGAARSVIANGPLAGKTLNDALKLWSRATRRNERQGTPDLRVSEGPGSGTAFPLLIKFLDANENLSVQVHPSPAYSAAHPEAHLKTESWYILEAAPGSVIYKGIKPGVTREQFENHIADGTVVNDLISIPAVVSDCHNLPSGTCHALGAGVLVAEVQTPSDTTFRVFDWGRTGRELHVKQSLACIDFNPSRADLDALRTARLQANVPGGRLVKTEFFTIDELVVPAGATVPVRGCVVVIVLRGSGAVDWPAGRVTVNAGRTMLVPAGASAVLRSGEMMRVLVVGIV